MRATPFGVLHDLRKAISAAQSEEERLSAFQNQQRQVAQSLGAELYTRYRALLERQVERRLLTPASGVTSQIVR
ncbi:MAG: hypothetical protein ABI895_11535 [Deltaproteobacteria bacterium]